MLIKIPFQGFYESIHSDNVEYAIYNQVFTDYDTGMTNNDNLSNRLDAMIDYTKLYTEYSKEYVENFNDEFKLNLKFESLRSPREYNFGTDQIYCTITQNLVKQLYKETDKAIFKKHIANMFTSYEGFHSFYDNNINTWSTNPLTYDHNQLYCLLMAWLESNHFITHWNDTECYLMDNSINNDFIYEIIHSSCKNNRLFNIHDYLQTRLSRKQ